MKSVITIIFLLTLHGKFYAQLAANLTIENQSAVGNSFFFDIYITRASPSSQGDIYLGNADFAIRFNLSNFTNPIFSKEGSSPGFCNFVPTNATANNNLFTRSNYFENASTNISSDILIINLNGPTPSDATTFNDRVAKIDGNSSAHRLGRFEISGISDPTGTAGLTWVTSNEATTLYSLDHQSFNSEKIGTLNAINPIDAALPIDLISFKVASIEGQKSQLTWVTASEQNNEGFSIQRKITEQDWQEIGFAPGGGTTSITQEYQFIDYTPYLGINYYRLGQIDYDGSIHYSQIEGINFIGEEKVKLYPNPVKHLLQVDGPAGTHYRICDGHGIWRINDVLDRGSIDVSDLSSGIYFLWINSEPLKFIKW